MRFSDAIIDFFYHIDPYQVVYETLGAFLGFWFAIILEKKNNTKKELEIIKSSLKNIVEELEDIKCMIENDNNNEEIGQLFIDIPIYEAAVQSGNILSFVDKPYYSKLLKAYSQIKFLSLAEAKENTYSEIDLRRYRCETHDAIEAVLSLIKKEKMFRRYNR